MIKIKMLKTTPGSLDGFTRTDFKVDREYEVPDDLAEAFIRHMRVGVAVAVAVAVRERKAVPSAPEKAVIETSPENKSSVDETIKEEEGLEDKKKILRVYQLADEFSVSSKKILRVAKKLGIFVSAPASGLSEEEARRIKSELAL